ncbi:hypothetical protein [Mangrovicoccus sp. HB161399]|uniref:hypothetical protein n=1 Tax=Mangrovicoccus sp. HB161399 TaxID=2720392 RepID=UPI0015556295|nr:hypothetical protein [Mangrovicoccus sp. HB161399]
MSCRSLLASAVTGGAVVFAVPAASQQADGQGTILTARISSSAEADDNYSLSDTSPGNAFLWNNTLSLGISSATPIASLSGQVSGVLRFADLPVTGTETDLDDGTVNLAYQRAIDDSSFAFNLFANDADVQFLDPLNFINDDGSFDDTSGTGRRTLVRGDFALELNGDGPIRFALTGRASDTSYYDTNGGTGLSDRETEELTATVGFDTTETAEIYVEANGYNDERGNGNDTQSASLRVGTKADVSPVTTIDANIGYQQVDTDYDDGSSKTRDGLVGALKLTRDLANGSAFASASSTNYAGGDKTDLMVGRELETPTGSFSGQVGASITSLSDASPIFQLAYATAGPTSQFNISLDQDVSLNDNFNDQLNLNLNASYRQLINPTSSFTLSALAGRRQDLESEYDDNSLSRLTLLASYDQDITRDWSVSTGLRHRTRVEDNGGDASSNSVFFTLTRSFSARR